MTTARRRIGFLSIPENRLPSAMLAKEAIARARPAPKPVCPFCGEPEATLDEIAPGQFACVCDDCGAIGPAAILPEVAVRMWNHRATRTGVA